MHSYHFSDAEADKADAKRELRDEMAREYREMAAQAAFDEAIERKFMYGCDN